MTLPRAPRGAVAAPHVEVLDEILGKRRLPCICPEQHDGAKAQTLSYSRARGVLVEQVACERCPRTWTRVTTR